MSESGCEFKSTCGSNATNKLSRLRFSQQPQRNNSTFEYVYINIYYKQGIESTYLCIRYKDYNIIYMWCVCCVERALLYWCYIIVGYCARLCLTTDSDV